MATIKYSETFEIVTEESAKEGEPAESSFIIDEQESLRGMVDLLRGTEPSCWPLPAPQDADFTGRVWFTSYGEMDYRTGEAENRIYHPATARDARYMIAAWKAGNTKGA